MLYSIYIIKSFCHQLLLSPKTLSESTRHLVMTPVILVPTLERVASGRASIDTQVNNDLQGAGGNRTTVG